VIAQEVLARLVNVSRDVNDTADSASFDVLQRNSDCLMNHISREIFTPDQACDQIDEAGVVRLQQCGDVRLIECVIDGIRRGR
jgi:hypothetical protein